jgi:hypothetical protein
MGFRNPPGRSGWKSALAVSLGLHALAVLAMCLLRARKLETVPPALLRMAGGSLIAAQSDGVAYLVVHSTEEESSPPSVVPPVRSPRAPEPVENPGPLPLSAPLPVGPQTPQESSGPNSAPGLGAGGPGQGTESGGTTRFFQVDTKGRNIVYLVDSSASMGLGGGLKAARRELLASVQLLPPTARFQIIVYHRQARPLLPSQPGWLIPEPETLRRVAEALESLPAEGSTDHTAGLRRALALQPDTLFFLTDADDLTPEQVRITLSLNRARAVIHVIELNTSNRSRSDMPMQMLARTTGGAYQAVDWLAFPR